MLATQPVVIVGAGPVGLAAALELARFDIPSIVLEQHTGPSTHPKTRNFNTRTMEIALGWGEGVYRRLRDIDLDEAWKSPIRFFGALTGKEFGSIDSRGFVGGGPLVSPVTPVMSSQDKLEAILRDAAAATGIIEVRFGHRVLAILAGASADDVEARVKVAGPSGEEYELTGGALVGADGIDSLVRTSLGIGLVGRQNLHHFVNSYFHADIEPVIGDERRGVLLYVANDDAIGVLQPLDARGRWLCQITVSPQQWKREEWPHENVAAWVRSAVGAADLDVDVRSVGLWRMNVAVAERLVQGRVVLVGDAAHQFPPTGGLGVNTGLQGMYNAMWKLALALRGEAGWSLLETYDAERREPSEQTADQSFENFLNVRRIVAAQYGVMDSDLTAEETIAAARRYGNHLGVELGPWYRSAAVVPDGTAPPEVEDAYSDYAPSATPGCRAPHVWLGVHGEVSPLHLLGPWFTVLTAPAGGAWGDAAREAGQRFGVRVLPYTIGAPGLDDPDGAFATAYGLDDGGAVLIRPDGVVAWRSRNSGDGGDLVAAVAAVLGRS